MAVNRHTALMAMLMAAALGVGIAVGLTVGWIIAPVEWDGPPPATLIVTTADLFAFDHNQARVHASLGAWGNQPHLCAAFANATDDALRQRLAMILLIMETHCE